MKLSQLGSNQSLVELPNGLELFFSYQTMVAARHYGERVRTSEYYSRTTSKHLGQMGVKDWPQVEDIEAWAKERL